MYKVFQSHRSIRRFKPIDLPEEHVHLILEAGRRAPTDATLHLWSAIRLDRELRKRIAELIGQQHVDEAGLFLVFIADLYRLERLLEYRGVEMGCVDTALLLFAAIDAALAAENMAVMAEALGYGTCFIGGIQNAVEEIIKILKKRGYIRVRRGVVYVTELGFKLAELLNSLWGDFATPAFTRKVEELMEQIKSGELSWREAVRLVRSEYLRLFDKLRSNEDKVSSLVSSGLRGTDKSS